MREQIKLAIDSLFRKVLGPLVRQAIKHNVSHSEFSEIVKEAYVEQSFEHFTLPMRKMSLSRVAVLTGLSRKEVGRLSHAEGNMPHPKIIPNSVTRVTMAWLSNPKFSESGLPKVLNIKEGKDSFAQLVEEAGGDVPAVAVLDELVRLGVANKESKNTVRLNNRGYVPNSSEIEKLGILASCTKDLLNTGIHNLETEDPDDARFQRQLIHRVPESLAKEFKEYSEVRAQDLLLEFNQWLREKSQGQPDNHKLTDIGFGIYYIEEQHNECDS